MIVCDTGTCPVDTGLTMHRPEQLQLIKLSDHAHIGGG
jgi:hypothetical protein